MALWELRLRRNSAGCKHNRSVVRMVRGCRSVLSAHSGPSLACCAFDRESHALGPHDPTLLLGLGLARSRLCRVALAHWAIIGVMAALARGKEIIVARVLDLGVMPMRGREDDDRGCDRMRLAVPGLASAAVIMAAFALALAPALGAHESDAMADLAPIGRISGAVFSSNGHRNALRAGAALPRRRWPRRLGRACR